MPRDRGPFGNIERKKMQRKQRLIFGMTGEGMSFSMYRVTLSMIWAKCLKLLGFCAFRYCQRGQLENWRKLLKLKGKNWSFAAGWKPPYRGGFQPLRRALRDEIFRAVSLA